MADIKVSVLMAVYNAEQFLDSSLSSLLRQTLTNIEIICVDDASTDASLALLHRYTQRDPRIKILSLSDNQGQAHARNVALSVAQGEYICMLDADDTYADDALALAAEVLDGEQETDCVLFECEMVETDGRCRRYHMPSFSTLKGEEAFRLSLSWTIHGIYMVRRELHIKVPYDDTCRLYSDDNTTRMHYLLSRRVGRCTGVYRYLQHPASATHRVSVRRFDYLTANLSMKMQMVKAGVAAALIAEYENVRWLNLVDVYMFYHVHGRQLTSSERRRGLALIRDTWQGIDRTQLDLQLRSKFGYCPMPTFLLFRLQEWCYFSLRALLGKNR